VSYRSRAVLTLAVLAVASAAAATIRWQPWTPTTACLLCGAPSSGDAAAGGSAKTDGPVGSGLAGSYARSSAGAYVPNSLIAGQLGTGTASSSSSSRSGTASRGWQPWGTGSEASRGSSSGASGPSTSLGGLWRLMSLSRPGHSGGAPVATAKNVVVRATHAPPAPRPAKTPTPTTHSGPPSSSSTPAVGTVAAVDPVTPTSGAPSTDPFHEHEAPPPDPFKGPGGFDPGAPGGGRGPSGGGKVSATPEPGSILLIGTGLLGIFGVLRQRRAL
jgi:hypothetical protein